MKTILFTALMLFPSIVLAAPQLEGFINAMIWLVVVGLVFWLIWWFLGYVGLPEPFSKVARVLIGLFALIFLLYFVLSFLPPLGHGLR